MRTAGRFITNTTWIEYQLSRFSVSIPLAPRKGSILSFRSAPTYLKATNITFDAQSIKLCSASETTYEIFLFSFHWICFNTSSSMQLRRILFVHHVHQFDNLSHVQEKMHSTAGYPVSILRLLQRNRWTEAAETSKSSHLWRWRYGSLGSLPPGRARAWPSNHCNGERKVHSPKLVFQLKGSESRSLICQKRWEKLF